MKPVEPLFPKYVQVAGGRCMSLVGATEGRAVYWHHAGLCAVHARWEQGELVAKLGRKTGQPGRFKLNSVSKAVWLDDYDLFLGELRQKAMTEQQNACESL